MQGVFCRMLTHERPSKVPRIDHVLFVHKRDTSNVESRQAIPLPVVLCLRSFLTVPGEQLSLSWTPRKQALRRSRAFFFSSSLLLHNALCCCNRDMYVGRLHGCLLLLAACSLIVQQGEASGRSLGQTFGEASCCC